MKNNGSPGWDSEPSRPGVFLMTDSFETGGSERQFAALAQSLDRRAFQVHPGCIQRQGAFLDGLDQVAEFRLGGSLYGAKSLVTRLRLAQYLRRNHIAVAHAFDFYTNLSLIPAARFAGVPVVIGSQRQLGDLLSHSKSRAQAAVLHWCDAVVCNSRAAAERLFEHGLPERRVVIIGNGLPSSAFEAALPAQARRPGAFRVGMIARMNARSKQHEVFLRAAARLRSRCPGVEFVLVGDGPLRAGLEREAESLGLGDGVSFLGDRQDVSAILVSLDVSVLTSSSESLSNAILESMAAGVPVVASRVGGNPELITRDRGILVPSGNDEAFANAIELLLRNPAMRAQFGRNARRFAQANFTLEQMRKRNEELYADLLEKKNWRANRSGTSLATRADRIRVAVVAASPRYVGGQSVQADLLVRHWQDDSEVEARFIPIDTPLPRPIAWIERIPFLRTLVREPFYLLSIWRGLRKIDIVHIFSASYWSFLVAPVPAWIIARLRGAKVILHYHSGEARDHLRQSASARTVLKDADSVVVPSGYLADVFREFGLRTQIVPNIVDLAQFKFRERKPLRPRLICTRGFHPYYCVDVVVRAFTEIQRVFPEATLVLAGKGPLETQVRKLVHELNLTGVEFAGAVPHPNINRCYDGADICVNASSLDNMPVSILEAFASGTPVATTDPEGMSHLVEHERTGLVSEPGDARALAENVIRLLRDPELASTLASNAREEAQRYSWGAVRRQWLCLYRSLQWGPVERDAESLVPAQSAPDFRQLHHASPVSLVES